MKGKAASLLIFALFVVISWSSQTAAEVPSPTVIGPIQENDVPGDPGRDYIFFTPIKDLSVYGYIEEEFFIQGEADNWINPDSGASPYMTRIVVRRPVSNKRFNGTVFLEWQNVTGGYDKDVHWSYSWEHFIRSGYAWVGVSVQGESYGQGPVGVDYLKDWSPDRYGALDVTAGGTLVGCELCMDIFSQAAQAVRNPYQLNPDPMGGLKVRKVIAVGASQSQWNLVWYHNFIHPDHQVVDAFLLFLGVGAYSGPLHDGDVKVFKVNTETDIASLGEVAVRQPDSDRLRTWEVAGASHNDWDSRLYRELIWNRDGIPSIPPELYPCVWPVYSRVPFRYVLNAACDHLIKWLKRDTPPPSAPPIEVEEDSSITILRDEFGNALGGIRLPHFEVPTATNTGVNNGPEGSFCYLHGSYVPFDDELIRELYRNHGAYVSKFNHSVKKNLKAGYILKQDAKEMRVDAAHSDIP
jgi:hypothetical protein